MYFNLVLDVIFAWVSVVLAFLLVVIWLLRILIKKKVISPKSFLGRSHRALRLSHIWLGVAFLVTSIVHAVSSSEDLISLNYGTLVVIVAALLAAMYMIKKKVERKAWMNVHRMLTVGTHRGHGNHHNGFIRNISCAGF